MKLKSKTILIDENEKIKIRPCYHNYARMTTLEYLYCEVFIWKTVQNNIIYSFKEVIEPIKEIVWFVLNIISLPILPILLYIKAKKQINKAKNEVWKDKCYDCKYRKNSPMIKERLKDMIIIGECAKCKLIDGMPTKFIEGVN